MAEAAPETDPADVRRTILILSVCGFGSALSTRFVDPMITVIARDLSADPLSVALLSTAYALPYALIQLVLGPIGDALGKELITKLLMIALTIMLFACTLAPNLTSLFIFRVLSGAAAGGIIPMALATIGDRVVMGERQVAIGRFLAATITGGLLGGVGAGIVSEYVGWRGAFAIAAVIATVATGLVLVGFRSYRSAGGELSFGSARRRYVRIFAIPRVRWLMSFVFVEGIFVFGGMPYLAAIFERAGTGGATEAGLAIGAFAVGGIIYTFMVRWLLRVIGLLRMLKLGGFVAGGGLIGLAPVLPAPVAIGALLVAGIGFYMLHNSFQTQMTEVVPEARASAVSLHAFAFFTGQALGPVVFGLVLAQGGQALAFAICAIGALVLGLTASRILGTPLATEVR